MAQSRMTISLPRAMASVVEAVSKAEHRTRSELVREALRRYLPRRAVLTSVATESAIIRELGFPNRAALTRALKQGAKSRGARDRAIAAEWFPIDDEAWRNRHRS